MDQQGKDKTPRHLRALSPRFVTKGITGTQLGGGVITGKENNPQLTGLNWVSEAEEMLRTDPIVRRSWHMLRQTLLSATWRFIPGIEDDPVSEKLANFANEAFGFDGYSGQMSVSWEDQLSYLLSSFHLVTDTQKKSIVLGLTVKARLEYGLTFMQTENQVHIKSG